MPETAASRASRMYNERRHRAAFLPNELLSDHAWDILLWLFIETKRGRRVTALEASQAANVPEQVGLRWISALRDSDLLTSWWGANQIEQGLMLSDKGYRSLEAYFEAEV